MKTEVEYRDDKELIIRTIVQRSDWRNAAFRKMAEQYHVVRAAQALEAVPGNHYRYIGIGVVSQEYWDDAVLAARDQMVLITTFHVKYITAFLKDA